jgi:hypothetical protein
MDDDAGRGIDALRRRFEPDLDEVVSALEASHGNLYGKMPRSL